MGENSKIEWTDHTFNPWIGCTKVAAGCAHCYAEAMAKRTGKAVWGPSGTRVVTSPKYWQQPIDKWNKRAIVWPLHEELCPLSGVENPILEWERRDKGQLPDPELMRRPRVFCASLADVFEDWQGPIMHHGGDQLLRCDSCGKFHADSDANLQRSCECSRFLQRAEFATLDDVRRELFKLIDATPYLDWILLTKRPENILRMWPERRDVEYTPEAGSMNDHQLNYRENVWLLGSVAEQKDADANIPELLKCRDLVPVLGLSCEPLVGPVDLRETPAMMATTCTCKAPWKTRQCDLASCHQHGSIAAIDWVIAGGESGHGARPMHPDWPRVLRDQCVAAGVPFFFKQWGEYCPFSQLPQTTIEAVDLERVPHVVQDGASIHRVGKKHSGRQLDGREWNEFPKPLVPSP